jgi:nitrate reductase NapAB chaperone NapD
MPVLAYIVSPRSGEKNKLLKELNTMQHCEAFSADNADILILVTDTPDKETEKQLEKQLNKIESMESLSMTFGYNDELQYKGEGDGHEDR